MAFYAISEKNKKKAKRATKKKKPNVRVGGWGGREATKKTNERVGEAGGREATKKPIVCAAGRGEGTPPRENK